MSVEFWQTGMGKMFFEGTMPKLVRSVDRLADVVEKLAQPEQPASAPVSGLPLGVILDYVKSVDGKDWLGGDAFDDFGIWHRQLRALWTAFCIINDFEADTRSYDTNLRAIWDMIVSVSDIEGSEHTFADYDSFDEYMCKDLV